MQAWSKLKSILLKVHLKMNQMIKKHVQIKLVMLTVWTVAFLKDIHLDVLRMFKKMKEGDSHIEV